MANFSLKRTFLPLEKAFLPISSFPFFKPDSGAIRLIKSEPQSGKQNRDTK